MNFVLSYAWMAVLTSAMAFAGVSSTFAQDRQVKASTHAYAGWKGRWIGQEGLFVAISLGEPGTYRLEMMDPQDATRSIVVDGYDTKGGIGFDRDGTKQRLRKATGRQTGLKWLSGRKDCLMVEAGEGFCRP